MEYADYYFQQKMKSWGNSLQERKDYIKKQGREGLKQEFESDPTFKSTVCPLIHKIGDIQLRSELLKSLEGLVDDLFGAPIRGEVNIIIGAIADACGYTTISKKLFVSGVILLIPVIAILLSRSKE